MIKNSGWKMFFTRQFFKTLWLSLAFTKVNKYSQKNTVGVDPWHLKVEDAE